VNLAMLSRGMATELRVFMNIELRMPEKRPELLVLEKSPLYVNGVVVRLAESLKVISTQNNLAQAKAWCRRLGYTWVNKVKPPRMKGMVEA
jgi:hypothetical protein